MANFPPPPSPAAAPQGRVQFGKVQASAGHRVVMYGPGGIGKTTMACAAPGPVAFFDLDESLAILRPAGEVWPVQAANWQGMRVALQSPGWDSVKTIVIDSGTKAEELALAHLLATVRTEKGRPATSIEDYGFGKGYTHLFDTFLPLLGDLDAHCRAGRNVVMICHDCTTTCPNPMGEDWLRYEPRLQSPNSGKASIRLRVKEWADHMLWYGYDVVVDDGKGKGSGTRTIYPAELPHCMAKSRSCRLPMPVTDDAPETLAYIWQQVLGEVA